jgi:hypothetical protein
VNRARSAPVAAAVAILLVGCANASAGPTVSGALSSAASSGPSLLSVYCSDVAPCLISPGTWATGLDGVPDDAFIPGLTFTVGVPWTSREHWQSELELAPADPDDIGEVRFWIDMAPGGDDGEADPDQQFDAAGMLDWIVKNRSLVVGPPRDATVAGLPSKVVFFTIPPAAQSRACGPGCALTVGRPHLNCCIEYGQGEYIREYVLDVGPETERHTLLIDLDAPSLENLDTLDRLLKPILDGLTFPAEWVIWCGRTGPPHIDCSR